MRDSLRDYEEEQVRKNDKKRKMDKLLQILDIIFCIPTTPACRLIEEDFKIAI